MNIQAKISKDLSNGNMNLYSPISSYIHKNSSPATEYLVDQDDEDYSHRPTKRLRQEGSVNNYQSNDSFNATKSCMWECSDCNKLFTSKSNLKVHLRVHTRIKPYHCKSCAYSCMHHSSIKEHLAKLHPGVIHSSTNPAYVFNSVAVPDPDQFNSADFNRDAFIAEAKQSNDKLMAQMSTGISPYQQYAVNKRSIASSSNVSPVSNLSNSSSNYTSPSMCNELENTTNDEEFYSNNDDLSSSRTMSKSNKRTRVQNNNLNMSLNKNSESLITTTSHKFTPFSINSILIKDEKKSTNTDQAIFNYSLPLFSNYLNYFQQQQVSSLAAVNTSPNQSQLNFFYSYLSHLNQKQFLSNFNTSLHASNGSINFDNSS